MSLRSCVQLYFWERKALKRKNSAIFYSLSAFFLPYEPLRWCYKRLINPEIISEKNTIDCHFLCCGYQVIQKHSIKCATATQKNVSDLTFKTFYGLLSVSKDKKLSHSHNKYSPAFFCLMAFNWLHIEMNDKNYW